MTDYPRQQTGDCPPPKTPADQPHPPGESTKCRDVPSQETGPEVPQPDPCRIPCHCPESPSASPDCVERLIVKQADQVTAGKKAEAFKAELVTLLGKAKTAQQEYNSDKYDDLVGRWVKQDGQIAGLIQTIVCKVPCWRCVIECHVCPLLNKMRDADRRLYGDGRLYPDVHDLYDKRYWHERDRDAKQREFDRIKGVLVAWEKPAQTIEKLLADDAKLIEAAEKSLPVEPAKVVYDVFLRLVPMHLAIAPPTGATWQTAIGKNRDLTTAIGKEYTAFCKCDEGAHDYCCGPDVKKGSLRQRLLGPQPYLVSPNDYIKVICCLVEAKYSPAKEALASADAAFQAADDEVKRYKAVLEDGLKAFDKDARGAIPSVVDCRDYEPCEDEPQSSQAR